MHFEYVPYTWVLLFSALLSAGMGVYAWRRRSVAGAVPLLATAVIGVVWSLSNALEMSGSDLPTKLFWANVQYMCYGALPLAWLVLILRYTRREHWLTRRRLVLLSVVPFTTAVLVWLDPLLGLVRHGFYLDTGGEFPVIGKTYGPWLWVIVAYAYALFLSAAYLLIRTTLQVSRFYRAQHLILLFGLLLPLGWHAMYVLGLSPIPRHDLAPVMLGIANAAGAVGVFRFRLFDLVPVAHGMVIAHLAEGVLVLDAEGRVLDLNPACQRIFGCSAAQATGQMATTVLRAWPGLADLCYNAPAEQCVEWTTENAGTQRRYEVVFRHLTNRRGLQIGCLIVLHDITERTLAEARLLQQQRALAALAERESLARELHDGLGQVLGYVGAQALAAREMLTRDRASAADTHLARLVDVAREAQADVRESILAARTVTSPERGLLPTLESYLGRFGQDCGISVELVVSDGQSAALLDPVAEIQLLRIVQEALTNVRKHAQAQQVRVAFSIQNGTACVRVKDDGRGFEPGTTGDAERHFGLHIMRERAEQVGGQVRVQSAPGQGTQVTVCVPLCRKQGSDASLAGR